MKIKKQVSLREETKMTEIMGLIVLLAVSVVVFSGWFFLKRYCVTAVEYLSKHPRSDFLIHVFTGLGSGWLIGLWMRARLKTLGFFLSRTGRPTRFGVTLYGKPEWMTGIKAQTSGRCTLTFCESFSEPGLAA
jgi:hypothetical protein